MFLNQRWLLLLLLTYWKSPETKKAHNTLVFLFCFSFCTVRTGSPNFSTPEELLLDFKEPSSYLLKRRKDIRKHKEVYPILSPHLYLYSLPYWLKLQNDSAGNKCYYKYRFCFIICSVPHVFSKLLSINTFSIQFCIACLLIASVCLCSTGIALTLNVLVSKMSVNSIERDYI